MLLRTDLPVDEDIDDRISDEDIEETYRLMTDGVDESEVMAGPCGSYLYGGGHVS